LILHEDTKTTTLFNFPVQATSADGFKLALVDL
jgi:DNA polymerase-1